MKRRITIDLGEPLLSALDETAKSVRESRNTFVVEAVRRRLQELRREQVDAEFAKMAEDADFRAASASLEREWAPVSDEAWRLLAPPERGRVQGRLPAGRRRRGAR